MRRSFLTKLAIAGVVLVTWSTTAPVLSFGADSEPAPPPLVVSQVPAKVTSGRVATFSGTGRMTVLGVTRVKHSSTADLDILARLQTTGTWSAWTALGGPADISGAEDVAPRKKGAAAQRAGTDPLIVGQATAYEVRVTATGGPLPRTSESSPSMRP